MELTDDELQKAEEFAWSILEEIENEIKYEINNSPGMRKGTDYVEGLEFCLELVKRRMYS